MRRRTTASLAIVAPAALAAALLTPSGAFAADGDVRINEVQSNSATDAPDFIELTNVGTDPVDISGWIVKDDDDTRTLRVPAGTVLAPGGFFVIEPDVGSDGFGLGAADTARIFTADGMTLIDSYAYTDHAFSEGRLPDGTGAFVDTEPTPGAANVARAVTPDPTPVASDVVINEVMSDDPAGGPDWVELANTGNAPVDVSGWILRDNDPLSALPIAPGSVVEPGGHLVVETDVTGGFGLGRADEVSLLSSDLLLLFDAYAWTDHASTEGRLPDGTGEFADTEPTRGSANLARAIASPIVINEIESNGDPRGDWVELANTDQANTVDVSGWTLVDADPEHEPIVLPAGTTIESGGYLAIVTDGSEYNTSFGLGAPERVTLRNADGDLVATYSWESHAAASYARCADMTGDFVDAASATFELVNDCSTVEEPVFDVDPWPFNDEVRDAVAVDTWGDDMSGLDYSADGTLYAINNDNAEIFELAEGDDGMFTIVQSWVAHYPDGSGQLDGEGLTVAADGAIFVSTERDNLDNGVSRPSIVRVELGENGTSTTTGEWNLTSSVGSLGANLGAEAIEWISDADAVRLSVQTVAADGTALGAYDPAEYGEHFGGVFAISVEQTGTVYLAVLEESGEVTILQSFVLGDAVEVAMALDWRAGGNALWALCDELCENRASELAFVDGVLTSRRDVAAPAGMPTGYTNEGLAIRWCDLDPAAVPTVAWISDTAHNGVSLRVSDGAACTSPVGTENPPSGGNGDDDDQDPGPVAGGGPDQGVLPSTGGSAPAGLIVGGVLLLLVGAALVLLRRRGMRVE